MKKISLNLKPGEQPPSAEVVSNLRSELSKLKHSVSGACTASLGLAVVGFLGLQWSPASAALGEVFSGAAFALGLFGFLVGHMLDKSLALRVAEVSPIPDSLIAEAAALSNASPLAREYVSVLKAQKREMTLVEFEAIRKLLASTPPLAARESLYG